MKIKLTMDRVSVHENLPAIICNDGKYAIVPFRGYCIQIVPTEHNSDLGHSSVIGFGNVEQLLSTGTVDNRRGNSSFYSSNAPHCLFQEIMVAMVHSAIVRSNFEYERRLEDQKITDDFADEILQWVIRRTGG